MRALAWVRVGENETAIPLGHGDMIGRLSGAALRIDDARVSEAHALVSLRGEKLMLLALRGRFRVGSRVVTEVPLTPGAEFELAEGLRVEVMEIELPERVLAIKLPDAPAMVLSGTTSVLGGAPPELSPGYREDAAAVIWAFDSAWRVSVQGGDAMPLQPGRLELGEGMALEVIDMRLDHLKRERTRSGLPLPLRIETLENGISIRHVGGEPQRIMGVPGRVAAALIEAREPISWRDVTLRVWPGDRAQEQSMRRRLDTALNRLRTQLRDLGFDPARVSSDGAGMLDFRITSHDRVQTGTREVSTGPMPRM